MGERAHRPAVIGGRPPRRGRIAWEGSVRAPIRVLLVDDQPLIRAGLAMLLDSEPDVDVVSQATDGAGAVAEAARLRPDVVVMDVRMPGMDGVEATRLLTDDTAGDPDHLVKVLILTTYHADETVYAAL